MPHSHGGPSKGSSRHVTRIKRRRLSGLGDLTGATMNARQLYLRWLATAFPMVHLTMLRMIQPGLTASGLGFMPPGGGRLAGLGDDPTTVANSIDSLDLSLTGGYTTPNYSPIISPVDLSLPTSIPYTPPPSASSSGGSTAADFASVAAAVNSITAAGSNIASAINLNSAQQNLLQINTQRAQMGLPPLSSVTGAPVSPGSLIGASPSLAQIEANLSGSSGMLPLLLLVGVVAIVAMSRKGGGGSAGA